MARMTVSVLVMAALVSGLGSLMDIQLESALPRRRGRVCRRGQLCARGAERGSQPGGGVLCAAGAPGGL